MAAALGVVVPFYSWAQGPASLQAEFDVYLPAAFDSAGTVLAKTQRAKKPLIDWDVLLQGIHEDFYTYTSIGLVKNMDTSKFKYPDWGFNSLFGFSWGCFGFYLGADFFDLFSSGSGISVISVFTLGLPLKIFVFTVKPYIGIGADVFSIINAHDYSNYEPDSDNPLSVFGADFELGIQVMIHWFFLSAAYRQRIYPSKKNTYTPKNDYQDTAAAIVEELFFKRFIISVGLRG